MSERTTSASTPASVASLLVARGFALFPLRAGSKLPAVARDWEHVATTSLVRLRQLSADPRANYGVACGPSNLVVLDLDVAKEGSAAQAAPGEPTQGIEVLRALAAGRELPRTFTVGTPSGGRHLYFRPPVEGPAPRNTVRRLGPLIDTRGVGGYVVAPGSRVDGVEYEILRDAPIAELPEWISTLLRPLEARPAAGEPLPLATALGPVGARLGGAYARTALEREAARVEAARVGTRNDTLNRAAYSLGTLVGSGVLDQEAVESELTRAALAAGLDERETAGTVRSGLTAGMARPRRLVGVGASAAAAGVHQLRLDGEELRSDGEGLRSDGEADGQGDWRSGGQGDGRQGGYGDRRPGGHGDGRQEWQPDERSVPVRTLAGQAQSDERSASARTLAAEAQSAARALIPTLVPAPADWPRVFGRFGGLGTAASALRQELAASAPGFALPPEVLAQGRTRGDDPQAALDAAGLVRLLDELEAAYDLTARAGGALAGSARWLGIQTLADLLRDLREELEAAVEAGDEPDAPRTGAAQDAEPIPAQAFALVRALAAVAGRRIVTLAEQIAVKLGADGLHRSPLGHALRRTRRAAKALSGIAVASPLTPARFATGRGALQAQLAAMRRDLRTATADPAAHRAA